MSRTSQIVEKMLAIPLEQYGVDYDGWGTYFQE